MTYRNYTILNSKLLRGHMDSYPVQYLGYCTVCNSFNLNPYFNLMDISMTHHRATSSIRVTNFTHFFTLFSTPFFFLKFQKTLSPSLSSIRSFSRTPWLQLAATAFHSTNSGGGSSKFPMSL